MSRLVRVTAFYMSDDRNQALAHLLSWYRDMGVDAAAADVPTDWLSRGNAGPGHQFTLPNTASALAARGAPAVGAPAQIYHPPATQVPLRDDILPAQEAARRPAIATRQTDAAADARLKAGAAATLDELRSALEAFDGCALKATAKNLCFYRGAVRSPIMLVGEAPGREEDIEGRPFVGRAGQLLDKMLGAIGLAEDHVHITNIVYWRPPGNRPPTPAEALACRPFLDRQIELVAPDVIVAIGGSAAKELFGVAEGIMRLRGRWRDFETGGRTIAAMATLHPAYLLRTPAAKHMAWRDLLELKAKIALHADHSPDDSSSLDNDPKSVSH